MINCIVLLGRLTADPELKTTPSGVSVCSFCVAVDRNFTDKATGKREADFINIVAWRSTADFVSRYFTKGQLVAVQGSLQSRKWQDKDGNSRISWEVQADNVSFAESKRSDAPAAEAQPTSEQPVAALAAVPEASGYVPIPDEGDLPF